MAAPRSEWQRYQRHLSTARREIRRAVERAQGVDLLEGHRAEAYRLAVQARDAASDLLKLIEAEPESKTDD